MATTGLGGPDPVRMGRRDRAGPWQGNAERLDEAAHGAGRAHDHAGALGRSQTPADNLHLILVHGTGPVVPPEAAAVGAGSEHLALVVADEHRSRDQLDRRHVGTHRRHQLRRHGLVAAADQHHRIHRLGPDHLLRVHGHEVAQEHAGWTGEGLVDGDRRELHREPPCQHDTPLHRLDQAGHVAVARVEVAEGVGDADDRPIQGIVGKACGLDERLAQKQRETRVAVAGEVATQAGRGRFGVIAHDERSSICYHDCQQ